MPLVEKLAADVSELQDKVQTLEQDKEQLEQKVQELQSQGQRSGDVAETGAAVAAAPPPQPG